MRLLSAYIVCKTLPNYWDDWKHQLHICSVTKCTIEEKRLHISRHQCIIPNEEIRDIVFGDNGVFYDDKITHLEIRYICTEFAIYLYDNDKTISVMADGILIEVDRKMRYGNFDSHLYLEFENTFRALS